MSTESKTIILRCTTVNRKRKTIDIQASAKLIKCSQVLRDVCEYTEPDSPVTVPIEASTLTRLMRFVDESPEKRDKVQEAKVFAIMEDQELFAFAKAADYLDIEQLRVAIGDYMIDKFGNMTATQIGEYLGVQNDYTEEERLEMVTNPSMFYMKQDPGY
uniref:SKP1-like protein n=1 Tax=Panagrellus redivivus TaxID=6233 RepID=A0A7E4UMA8_PANRE